MGFPLIPQSSPCLGQLSVSSDSGSTSNIEEGQNNDGLHTGRLYEAADVSWNQSFKAGEVATDREEGG